MSNNPVVNWSDGNEICQRCPLIDCIDSGHKPSEIIRRKSGPECPLEYAVWLQLPLALASKIAVNVTCGDTIHMNYYRLSVASAANGMRRFFEELLDVS